VPSGGSSFVRLKKSRSNSLIAKTATDSRYLRQGILSKNPSRKSSIQKSSWLMTKSPSRRRTRSMALGEQGEAE
jgi:hypothetical protein